MTLITLKNGFVSTLLVIFLFLSVNVLAEGNLRFFQPVPEPLDLSGSTDTPDLVLSRLLKLYPNPNSTNQVNIKGFTKNTTAYILIKNAIGYVVVDEKQYKADESGDINLNIQTLQQGHYYIFIKVERGHVLKKLIKI
ncbi:T9SS type A sorting domain-containing protein [Rufibacter tibetensis]|uniref:Secretion system C-terminal sorting domain-containing protein n=1 Tax=Rufibacter tibetensis TaxID=512763 RepID=A0A0P0CFC2_9BACT|nr:T9SS type A sorting domain-containing protein [Rufibacter tibetensis]ALJ00575.1 hypothetical protein DC20_18365 [Rufibacter tibetensis]